MKTKLLKLLRKRVARRYQLKKEDGKWRLYCSQWSSIFNSTTKEEMVRELSRMWHKEAEEYLWENKNRRKNKNSYVW